MTIRHRRIFFFSCIVLFLVAAGLVLFFAGEYTFDAHSWSFVKTALVVVTVEPKADRVTIGERAAKLRSNEWRLTVPPGTYAIRIEKEGYWLWEDTVLVTEGQAMRVDGTTLLPKREPLPLAKNIEGFSVNGSGSKVLLWEKNPTSLFLLELESGQQTTVQGLSGSVTYAGWSRNNRRFFVTTASTVLIGDAETTQLVPLPGVWKTPRAQFAGSSDDTLFIVSDAKLSRATIGGIREPFQMRGLETQDFSNATLLPSPTRYATLLDHDRSTLTIADTVGEILAQFSNVTYAAWSPDGKTLAYGNGVELYLADDTFEPMLLERTGEGLVSIAWFSDRDALTLSYGNGVRIIDAVRGNRRKKYSVIERNISAIQIRKDALLFLERDGLLRSLSFAL